MSDDHEELSVNEIRFSRDRETIILSTSKYLRVISTRTFNTISSINQSTDMGGLLCCSSLCASVQSLSCQIQVWMLSPGRDPRRIGDVLQLSSTDHPILNIQFNPKRFLVLTADALYIFDLPEFKLLSVVSRGALASIKYSPSLSLLTSSFCHENGLCAFVVENGSILVLDSYTLHRYHLFTAHTSPVSSIEFDMSGRTLATASTKGTLVRIFKPTDSRTMDLVCILRRGRSESPITSISFDPLSRWVTICGETDTAHLFTVPIPYSSSTTNQPVLNITDSSIQTVSSMYAKFMNIFPKQYKEAVEAVRDTAHVKLRRNSSGDKFFASIVDDKLRIVVLSIANDDSSAFAFVYSMNDANSGECKLRDEHCLSNFDDHDEVMVMDMGNCSASSVTDTPTTVHGETDKPIVEMIVLKETPPTTLEKEDPSLQQQTIPKKPKKKRAPKKKPSIGPEIFDVSE